MERPYLCLLHGFPHDHTLWEPQVAGLKDDAHVHTPDLRGFGAGPEASAIVTMEEHAADILRLLDERGVERVVLAGLSMGGYVALAFAANYPERLQGLVFCNTRANADTAEAAEGRRNTAKEALEKGMAVIARGMLPKVLAENTRVGDPALARRIEDMMARQPAAGVAASSLGMAQRPDRTALLPSIAVPTLIITGSEDSLMPLPTSEVLHHGIPGSRLVVIPGVAHLSNVEAPERFNAEVRTFIRSLSHA